MTFILSAFADEISPDPQEQVEVLSQCGVKHVELRSVLKTNVLDLSDLQIQELKSLFDQNGIRLSAIGSPVGKVKIDSDFEPHLERFKRAMHLCQVFGTPNIRIFSYYPPGDGHDWTGVNETWTQEVFSRLNRQADLAEKAGLRLFHENEHRIFGDSPERIAQLFSAVKNPAFRAAYDAANFVFCGYDPWTGWEVSRPFTAHLHLKDWKAGEPHGSLLGEGQGRWPEVLAAAKADGYHGFATLEPHLLGGGPTGGITGPELFPKAVAAARSVLERAGCTHE